MCMEPGLRVWARQKSDRRVSSRAAARGRRLDGDYRFFYPGMRVRTLRLARFYCTTCRCTPEKNRLHSQHTRIYSSTGPNTTMKRTRQDQRLSRHSPVSQKTTTSFHRRHPAVAAKTNHTHTLPPHTYSTARTRTRTHKPRAHLSRLPGAVVHPAESRRGQLQPPVGQVSLPHRRQAFQGLLVPTRERGRGRRGGREEGCSRNWREYKPPQRPLQPPFLAGCQTILPT